MSSLMQEMDRQNRSRKYGRWLAVLAVLTGFGAFLTVPVGVIRAIQADGTGWLLLGAGLILLAGCVAAGVAAARFKAGPESLPGKANPAFDEPRPSADPNGGYSTSGMQIGGI